MYKSQLYRIPNSFKVTDIYIILMSASMVKLTAKRGEHKSKMGVISWVMTPESEWGRVDRCVNYFFINFSNSRIHDHWHYIASTFIVLIKAVLLVHSIIDGGFQVQHSNLHLSVNSVHIFHLKVW